jgi:hypothetical protein
MYREFFAGMEHTGLALFAMLLFMLLFALVLLRLFALRSRRDYDAVALLPFDDSLPSLSADRNEVNP